MRYHFSFHKCLTKYVSLTLNRSLNNANLTKQKYKHFNSDINRFLKSFDSYSLASLNNHGWRELQRIMKKADTVTVFVRDPRDLLVSGYHYHKKGREFWCQIDHPNEEDWREVNGNIDKEFANAKTSFSNYLKGLDEDQGMIAELNFRKKHFDALDDWLSLKDPRVIVIPYECILGNEVKTFTKLAIHHGFVFHERLAIRYFSSIYAANRQTKNSHIRNPAPGQGATSLSFNAIEALEQQHPGLLRKYENFLEKYRA